MLAEAPPLEPLTKPAPKPDPAPAANSGTGLTSTDHNLREHWTSIMHAIAQEDLNVGVALGRAHVNGIEGDTLSIAFSEANKSSRDLVERTDSLSTIQSVLQATTANIRRCRIEGGHQPASKDTPQEDDASATSDHLRHHVAAKDAEEAMADPHVAKVVEVFRGEIVDIQHQPRGG